MSSDVVSRKKKNTSDSTPAPDGDHRKRRRNRTTQSCLNCHTSKRMCDRKRPACARCTQLGLVRVFRTNAKFICLKFTKTGLCVYEVDDPSQRTDSQDESSRLLKRVAELEGVIRELKNKPHPRWVQSTSSGEEFEKWHSRPQGGDESCSSNAPSPPVSSSSSDKGDSSSNRGDSLHPNAFSNSLSSSIHLQVNPDSRRMRSPFSPSSPLSGASPGLVTPTDEYSFSPVGIAGQGSPQDYDLTSMFMNYPGMIGDNSSFSPLADMRYTKQNGHCGCVHETINYNNMLELSVRLRKASDVLSRSPSHQLGGFCQLHQRVSELDSFTTNVLSDISSASHSERAHPSYHPQMFPQRIAHSRSSLQGSRPWDIMPSNSNSPSSFDDSFMTWEPPRRS